MPHSFLSLSFYFLFLLAFITSHVHFFFLISFHFHFLLSCSTRGCFVVGFLADFCPNHWQFTKLEIGWIYWSGNDNAGIGGFPAKIWSGNTVNWRDWIGSWLAGSGISRWGVSPPHWTPASLASPLGESPTPALTGPDYWGRWVLPECNATGLNQLSNAQERKKTKLWPALTTWVTRRQFGHSELWIPADCAINELRDDISFKNCA